MDKAKGMSRSAHRLYDFLTNVRAIVQSHGLSWSQGTSDDSNLYIDILQVKDGNKGTLPRARLILRHDAASTEERMIFGMTLSTPPDRFGATVPLVHADGRQMAMVFVDTLDEATLGAALDRFEEAFEQLEMVRLVATRSDLAVIVDALKLSMEEVHARSPEPSFDDCMRHYARFEPLLRLVTSADPTLARRELRPAVDRFREQAAARSERTAGQGLALSA